MKKIVFLFSLVIILLLSACDQYDGISGATQTAMIKMHQLKVDKKSLFDISV